MKKILYRLQIGERGIYSGRYESDLIQEVFYKYNFFSVENHPSPFEDKCLWVKTKEKGAEYYSDSRFAFPSIKSIFQWFYGDSIEQFFKEPLFKIHIIEVDLEYIVESKHQVIYEKEKGVITKTINSYKELIDLI